MIKCLCVMEVILMDSLSVNFNVRNSLSGGVEGRWQVESQSPDYKIAFFGDTCEVVAPKGLTLWWREKMKGDVTIEYDACVMDEGKPGDRLSDLNCFWMASDPKAKDIWERMAWRNGNLQRCFSLQLYYVGYGGNNNTTTRFRRYNGNPDSRPLVLKEYTDKAHLLSVPNRWYHIKLQNEGNRVRYYIDGELLVDYYDSAALKEGWFGFRTFKSRVRIANFKYTAINN